MTEIKQNQLLNEKLIIRRLSSGILCFILPKKDYVEKQAMICTKYGSLDNKFSVGGKSYDMPAGVAHFLEHKLFEEENGNVFEKFIREGADCNAFTNFTATAYYFNCIDNFEKNLEILLKFTSKACLTDENVEKEKGIIAQEITMYDDDANWIAYFNMIRGLYQNHPVRENIAGTVDSINKITKEMLYDCYNYFYQPSNMALVVSGDVDENYIFETTDNILKEYKANMPPGEIKREYGNEPRQVCKNYVEQSMCVAAPIFHIGFKENNFDSRNTTNAATKVLLDILCGESSPLYNSLYNQGLIDNNFNADYSGNLYFGLSMITGISDRPQQVCKALLEEIGRLKNDGISDELFDRLKKKHIGRFIKGLNAIDAVASSQVDYFTKNTDLIEVFEAYHNLKKQDLTERLNEHFDKDFMTLSVINPQ